MSHDPRELRALLVPFISKRVAPQDVDDVVQDVFVRIQRGLSDLREGDKLIAWSYQIARNAIIDHARRAVREHDPLEHVPSEIASSAEAAAAAELALVLGHFIEMLPAPYRAALELTELRGMTQAEAARHTGLSLPGMKSRVQRARAHLRELLEACCDIELDTRGGIIDVEPRNRPASLPHCCSRERASSGSIARLQDMTNTKQSQTEPVTTDDRASGCCGGPAPAGANACCVKDAVAKAAGEAGCGCGPKVEPAKRGCC